MDLAGTLWRSLPESFTSLFQKRPPIQRAERWSPRARGEISLSACSFLPSEGSRLRLRLSLARQFSFAPLLPKKKASKRFKKALCRKGNPPLVRFFTSGIARSPRVFYENIAKLCQAKAWHSPLRWRFLTAQEFRALRGVTSGVARSSEFSAKTSPPTSF